MKCLHPVFNVVKLTPAPPDPIPSRHVPPPPPPELIDGEEEYIIEEILDSRMFRRWLQYLVKWDSYSVEGNTQKILKMPQKMSQTSMPTTWLPHAASKSWPLAQSLSDSSPP
jgi:hypothetical protein